MNSFTFKEVGLDEREYIRPQELRQSNYEEVFDKETFIYDVLKNNNKIIFIAPPLTKEQLEFLLDNSYIDNIKLKKLNVNIYKHSRLIKIIVSIKNNFNNCTVFGKEIIFDNGLKGFDTSKVLYTLQKDNRIEWIVDWIKFYNKVHKPSLIVIYDNNSETYDIEELVKRINENDIQNCIVKSFPFKYGPGAFNGSTWDSDFCQYAAFEHIRYNIINQGYLLNVDIDELCYNPEKIYESVFDTIINKYNEKFNVYFFKGRWAYVCDKEKEIFLHKDHNCVEKELTCPYKYVVNLKQLEDKNFLGVHDVFYEKNKMVLEQFEYLHCRNINTNWKYKRTISMMANTEKYEYLNLSALFN